MLAAFVSLTLIVSPANRPEEKEKELPEAAQKELKKLEGKWKATKLVVEGREEEPKGPDGQEVAIEFKARKFLLGGEELFTVAALDPSTTPKILDFKALKDMGEIGKGKTYEGIYKLDGDTLVIALYIGEGQKRPEKFESAEGSKVVVVTFQREKK
ncbi:MAG: TIGR03067 domain-containing protein [Planctomycetia bacterium]|nr:TIGR03067 domain-containing protein [Planctomycetia bacterium]